MTLLVIDGNSIVNRAFYGIKILTTKSGQYTNGIFGFLNILLKLREECSPDHVAVAFDVHEPTFRHKMYDEYKAGRHAMPDELRSQMPVLKELLGLLGYKIVECPGYEADDILGTLSHNVTGDDRCYIATGDRDSLQLVSDNTTVLLAGTKMGRAVTTHCDREYIKTEYGVEPEQMTEIKALQGDSSDNIPGVAGVGPKTAGELIRKYGNIDYIYEHIDELDIKQGLHDKLVRDKDNAYLSRELGTISKEAPISTDPDDYIIGEGNAFEAVKLLAELEMFGMIEKLGLTDKKAAAPAKEKTESTKYEECRDLFGLLGELKNKGEACFLPLFEGEKLQGLLFDTGDKILCVEESHYDFGEFLKKLFESPVKKITTDTKLLYKYAFMKGIEPSVLDFDISLAGYILNPSSGDYSTERLSKEYNAIPKEITGCPDRLEEKAGSASCVKTLYKKLSALIEENNQVFLMQEIEMPLARVLASMEREGFAVDKKGIESFSALLDGKIDECVREIYDDFGFEFNLNSPKQLGVALFERKGIPAKKKTKSGYSTNAEVLEELADDYPVVRKILDYRTYAKLKSTYCDGLLKLIEPDGRIRSTLNQTETRTGRISSSEPNLQNIPVRSELGSQMRKFFTAEEGNTLADADYSQIELRVLADMADDKNMLDAFNSGKDIHAITASQVFGLPLEMVTPLMRSRAKAVNFGIVYGIGAFSLAKDIGVTRKEADNYIKGYLANFSGVDEYMKNITEKARNKGYAETLFGRRRYLPELTNSNHMLRAFGERVARNMPIQGTAADIIKIAMIKVYDRLKKEAPEAKLIMQVHDELIAECPEKDRKKVEKILREEMESACKMKVELSADVHSGKTWYLAKG